MSSHSGDENEYFPSMIIRSIKAWRLCQNGGEPLSLTKQYFIFYPNILENLN